MMTRQFVGLLAVLCLAPATVAEGGRAVPVADDPDGQAADTLRLSVVLAATREANPMLQAARFRADLANERVSQAGALPNPMLSFGLMNRPIDDFGAGEPMTMNTVELMQRFPWPGKLGFGEERAAYLAEAERLAAVEAEAAIAARAKSVYYRIAFADRALAIMEETRYLLRDLHQVTASMYAVGNALQQDVLQAEVAVAQLSEDITVLRQERLALGARLNALMGRAAMAAVGATELPEIGGGLPGVDSLMALAVEQRPALEAARQRSLAAQAGYRAARRALYPDITLTLAYNQRPEFTDMVTLMVGVSVPLWAGSRELAQRREMQARQLLAEAESRDLYNETYARLAELGAQADRAHNLSRLYSTSIIPQARASVESALSAYRVGRVDYMTVLANQMTVNRYEIESVRLAAEYHRTVGEIEALVGQVPGGAI